MNDGSHPGGKASASRPLRLGLPSKGRLSELATGLLSSAGLSFRRQARGLFAKVSGLPLELIFLRTDDIPTLCSVGAIDMGITGSDLVAEAIGDGQNRIQTRMNLGVGRCRLAVCVPDDSDFQTASDLDGKTIATSFPNVTRRYLADGNATANLVPLSGSVEVMIQLGVADAIVDLVETGSTLAANRLRMMETIGHYETVLIQNDSAYGTEIADRVVRRLEGVVIARDYSLLEYNIPRSAREQAEAITPGYNSPTINSLEDPHWCSVRVMVRRGEVIDAMERLEPLGASAIIETPITNCRL